MLKRAFFEFHQSDSRELLNETIKGVFAAFE